MAISVKAQGVGFSKSYSRMKNDSVVSDLTEKLMEDQGGSNWEIYKGGTKLSSNSELVDGETYIAVKQNAKVTLGSKTRTFRLFGFELTIIY